MQHGNIKRLIIGVSLVSTVFRVVFGVILLLAFKEVSTEGLKIILWTSGMGFILFSIFKLYKLQKFLKKI